MITVEREEFAVVLDFLPNGYPFDTRPLHRKTSIAQALSKNNFTLLELIPKNDIQLKSGQEVYIGEGKREEIHHVVGRIPIEKLTQTAKGELEIVVTNLVKLDSKRFIEFFNKAGPISTRMHQIELIPGIGKKHMWAIIEEREKKPFEDFEDLKNRLTSIPDPLRSVIRRILMEINGEDKYKIFTR